MVNFLLIGNFHITIGSFIIKFVLYSYKLGMTILRVNQVTHPALTLLGWVWEYLIRV